MKIHAIASLVVAAVALTACANDCCQSRCGSPCAAPCMPPPPPPCAAPCMRPPPCSPCGRAGYGMMPPAYPQGGEYGQPGAGQPGGGYGQPGGGYGRPAQPSGQPGAAQPGAGQPRGEYGQPVPPSGQPGQPGAGQPRGEYGQPVPPSGQPGAGAPPAGGQEGNVITVQNHAYSPATLTVRAGTTVRWMNRDTDAHTASGNGFDVQLPPGGEGSYTFSTAGTFDVGCRYHPNMHGQVIVQ